MPKWRFSWNVGDDNFADSFNVYVREALVGAWKRHGSTTGFTFDVSVPDLSKPFEVGVAAVVNNIEEFEEDWTVVPFTPASLADIPIPPDVTELSVAQVEESFDVRLRWPAVTDPHLAGYEIREGSAWETGIVRKFVAAGTHETTFGALAAIATTYQIKAKSIQGQWSETAATVAITVQAMSGFVAEATTNEAGGGFTGTKSGSEVVSGGIQLEWAPEFADDWTDNADTYTWEPFYPHKGSGTYVTNAIEATDGSTGIVVDEVPMLTLGGSKAERTSMVAADYNFIMQPEFKNDVAVTPGTASVLDKVNGDEEVLDGLGMTIEIDTTPDDPNSSPTWDGYRTWIPGARYRYRGVRFRVTFTSVWWWVWRISTFQIIRYRKNLKDEGEVTISSTGGTPITFAQPFTKIPQVVSFVNETTLGSEARASSVTRTGCDIRIFNTAGTEQSSGTAGWHALGV